MNVAPTSDAATSRSEADAPDHTNAIRKTTLTSVPAIDARRRSRWYLADLSSFTTVRIVRTVRAVRIVSGRSSRSVELNRDQLRDAWFLRCHPVQTVRNLHRPAVMRDEDELRPVEHAAQHLHEPSNIGVVERRIDLVEQTERARLVLENRKHQRDRGQRLFAA